METKVLSVRVGVNLFDRISTVADRLYPKNYTSQPNRTQLLMDAINLFCDLGEAGSLDGMNLSQIDTADVVYSVNNDKEDKLKVILDSLSRIEQSLAETSEPVSDIENRIELVDRGSQELASKDDNIFTLNEAWDFLSAKENVNVSSKDTFRQRFTKHSNDKSYTSEGFRRIVNPNGKGYLYQLVP